MAGSDGEAQDQLVDLGITPDLMEQIMRAKNAQPSQFASYWEKDEADIDHATEEEIKNDPVKRILWAAENNKLKIVDELLEEDLDLVCCVDGDCYTPLHRAAYGNHREVAEILIRFGADLEARTVDGWQPLHSACFWNCSAVAELLIQNGACINAQTNGHQTPLHLAASQPDNKEVLKLLLMNPDLDANLKNDINETPKDICLRSSNLHYLFEIAEDSINLLR
ncbi:ankyrin repeat domain-containing protein 49-like isoform X2 [Lineus longissimus]|uniref:ankyrin repeat domain-containing protein 49-like isoform X2 n=1 Tax=Lineus longissimus TaxID=88925 RepID=UPI00315D0280